MSEPFDESANRPAIESLRARLAEAETLLREIREDARHFGMPTARIDAFLAPDSASHRETERE